MKISSSKKITTAATFAFAATAYATNSSAVPLIFFAEDISTSQSVAGTNSEAMRNSFLSNLVGIGNEDFEGFTVGETNPTLTFPGTSGSLSASLSGNTCVDNTASDGCGNINPGRWATSGDQFWETDSGGSFSIDLGTTPISAFGFYGTDIGDFDNQLIIKLTDVNNVETTYNVNHSTGLDSYANSLLFWGFIDTSNSYTNITFFNSEIGEEDVFGFDDMVIGDREQVHLVPAPATAVLLGIGLVGLVGNVRRIRARAINA